MLETQELSNSSRFTDPGAFAERAQSIAVKLSIDGFSLGDEFLMYNIGDVEMNDGRAKIAGYSIHLITKKQISQLAKWTQRCHLTHWRIKFTASSKLRAQPGVAICWHDTTQVRKLFNTTSYVKEHEKKNILGYSVS